MSKELDERARELPQLDNWVAEFSLTDEADVLDEFTLDQQAKIWGLMRTVWNTAQERTATRVQDEARLTGVQLGLDRARRAIREQFKPEEGTYHPLEIIIMYRDVELDAALSQAAAPATKEGE